MSPAPYDERSLSEALQSSLRLDIPRLESVLPAQTPEARVEELELVAGLRERRGDAVELFLERYRSLLFHCIGHFESDPSSRLDLQQEIVWYVLDRLQQNSFDSEKGSFGTWLYRVAWCRCVDLKRKDGARRNPKLTPFGDKLPDRADTSAGPVDVAGDEEIGDLVRRAMAAIEPEERTLLQMRFVDGRTISEISQALTISIEQTKYRLKRASTSLRRVLLNDFAMEDAVQ
jgi:RNA polymerase sigma factor (sigma-70 family)